MAFITLNTFILVDQKRDTVFNCKKYVSTLVDLFTNFLFSLLTLTIFISFSHSHFSLSNIFVLTSQTPTQFYALTIVASSSSPLTFPPSPSAGSCLIKVLDLPLSLLHSVYKMRVFAFIPSLENQGFVRKVLDSF